MKYLKRVSSELEVIKGGPEEEELMLQGVRFAFRVHQVRAWLLLIQLWKTSACTIREQFMPHSMLSLGHAKALDTPRFVQFAGGFDVDTMRAFQELKEKASMCRIQRQKQHRHLRQHRLVARAWGVRTRACSSYIVDLSIRHHIVVGSSPQRHSMICWLFFFLLLREIVECPFCCKRSSTVTNEQPLCLFRTNLCLSQSHPFVLPMSVFVKSFVLTDYVYKIYGYLCAM